MAETEILLSPKEYEKLTEELDYLKSDRRREVAERIRKARSFGDLSENAEYDAAKEEQAHLETRIAQRQNLLKRARVVDPDEVDHTRVNVGSEVTIRDESTDEDFSYVLVGALDADPERNRISYRSPVGKALYERSIGESVRVRLPGGTVTYKIKDIRWVGGDTDEG